MTYKAEKYFKIIIAEVKQCVYCCTGAKSIDINTQMPMIMQGAIKILL